LIRNLKEIYKVDEFFDAETKKNKNKLKGD